MSVINILEICVQSRDGLIFNTSLIATKFGNFQRQWRETKIIITKLGVCSYKRLSHFVNTKIIILIHTSCNSFIQFTCRVAQSNHLPPPSISSLSWLFLRNFMPPSESIESMNHFIVHFPDQQIPCRKKSNPHDEVRQSEGRVKSAQEESILCRVCDIIKLLDGGHSFYFLLSLSVTFCPPRPPPSRLITRLRGQKAQRTTALNRTFMFSSPNGKW